MKWRVGEEKNNNSKCVYTFKDKVFNALSKSILFDFKNLILFSTLFGKTFSENLLKLNKTDCLTIFKFLKRLAST